MEACIKGGNKQLQVRLGEVIHLEGFKACEGCPDCGLPREFCAKWEQQSNGTWMISPSNTCQYGHLVYDTVIGLFQCGDRKYTLDLFDAMQEDFRARSVAFSDKDIALWLRKELNVAGIRCLEII
jgi:hypothetical protein